MTDQPIIFSGPKVRALFDDKTQERRLLKPGNSLFDGGKWPNYLGPERLLWDKAWVDDGPSPAGNPGPYLKLPVLGVALDPLLPDEETVHRIYPLIQPGDRLWVQEPYYMTDDGDEEFVIYAEDQDAVDAHLAGIRNMQRRSNLTDAWAKPHLTLRPSFYMPRWASRLTLIVTDVRVQRLQDITEEDARAEGVIPDGFGGWRGHHGTIGYPTAIWAYHHLWESLYGPGAWHVNPWVVAISFDVHRGNIDEMGVL